jgi:integrase
MPALANKRVLTELLLQRLRPRAQRFLVWDSKQNGLALQIRPNGLRAWKVIYNVRGRTRWFHLGAGNAIGLKEARELARDIMFLVAKGEDPQAEKRARRSAGTFAELAERYREDHAKRHNKSWRQADALVRRYLLPNWGKLEAKAINRSDVRLAIGRIAAPVLANQVLAAASAIFSWAVKQEVITVNPCHGIERHETRSRERVLSDSELPLFWEAFDKAGPAGTALKLILILGQRPGEVGHMRAEHIIDGWWEMPGKPTEGWPGTKNGQSHRVWLPEPVQALLPNGKLPTPKALAPVMRSICNELGIAEKVTPHDLRRTHGTKITALGFGRDAMNRVQNHKEGGIASVYDRHGYADENKRVMEAVAAEIIRLAEGRAASGNVGCAARMTRLGRVINRPVLSAFGQTGH